jgi:hypothetical protein
MAPHVCPVCSGRGEVPAAFYEDSFPSDWTPGHEPYLGDTSGDPAVCRSCRGEGLVWPPHDTSVGWVAEMPDMESADMFTEWGPVGWDSTTHGTTPTLRVVESDDG